MTKPAPRKPLTAAKIRAVIRKAGLPMSRMERSSMVRGWGERLIGFWIYAPKAKTSLDISFKQSLNETWNREQMDRLMAALQEAGITGERREKMVENCRWWTI